MLSSVISCLRRVERALKPVTMTVCAYETTAIALTYRTDSRVKMPLVSEVMNKHKWAIPVLLSALTVHFLFLPERIKDAIQSDTL